MPSVVTWRGYVPSGQMVTMLDSKPLLETKECLKIISLHDADSSSPELISGAVAGLQPAISRTDNVIIHAAKGCDLMIASKDDACSKFVTLFILAQAAEFVL